MNMQFHAHLYFENNDRLKACQILKKSKTIKFFDSINFFGNPIGPHPLGMIEFHFNSSHFESSLNWIKSNHEDCSVLVHPNTGDDLKDHTFGVIWIGKPLQLDFSFFELIKTHPESMIHQPSGYLF